MQTFRFRPTFPDWQTAARLALREQVPPLLANWEELDTHQPSLALFDSPTSTPPSAAAPDPTIRVPRDFLPLAKRVSCHRDPKRWTLLYRLLWRHTHGESHLMQISVDDDMHTLIQMDKAVRRDSHKMRAFVRFRAVQTEQGQWYVAWFEPEHLIVELNAPFFRDRFASMRWSILTPDRCVHWDGTELQFTPPATKAQAPDADAVEDLWLTYFGSIFNPARVKIQAMQSEMPKKYWKNLPEAALIPSLIEDAPNRVKAMVSRSQQKLAPAQRPD
ncbi:DNA metabolism protein [Phragmitibacter flavus]|uniref:DNA metabolism protein n=1 Tax=Phragmitibacter flavus TaxID=2576071 RepID=A0A5R8KKU9_9BACT|nr:TIGR03915 family putative DNA repair protein [Phragmitibacter flavus]TLD72259.1 DNA metabolism protein [Phragmitibacter flavus]